MASIIPDKTLPNSTYKRVKTSSGKTEFIVSKYGQTRNSEYIIYQLAGDEKIKVGMAKGGIKKVLAECELIEYYSESKNSNPFK